MSTTRNHRLKPLEAARSLFAVLRDPDDTTQVFRLLDAMGSRVPPGFVKRFEGSRAGQKILVDRPEIFAVLRDRDKLAALPEGTLGRAYAEFMEKGGLTPEWLVAASEVVAPLDDDLEAYLSRRLRDTHDLWHVVTGFGGDLLGEASVLAFTLAQTASPGIGLLVSAAYLQSGDPDARRLITDAFARGLRAAWLPGAPWEELLLLPLEEVRARLRVGPPAVYEPFFAKDLPPGGLLAKAA